MHFLYVIYSDLIDKYYVGETGDIRQRLEQHNTHQYKGSFTRRATDWKVKLIIEFDTINEARRAESFIKKMNSRKFIERLLLDSLWLKEKFRST